MDEAQLVPAIWRGPGLKWIKNHSLDHCDEEENLHTNFFPKNCFCNFCASHNVVISCYQLALIEKLPLLASLSGKCSLTRLV